MIGTPRQRVVITAGLILAILMVALVTILLLREKQTEGLLGLEELKPVLAVLREEGFREAPWDGWDDTEAKVAEVALTAIADPTIHLVMLRISDEDGARFEVTAVIFRLSAGQDRRGRRYWLNFPGNVLEVIVSNDFEVIQSRMSTREFALY